MRRLISGLCAAVMAASMAGTATIAGAGPLPVPSVGAHAPDRTATSNPIHRVQWGSDAINRRGGPSYNHRRHFRPHARQYRHGRHYRGSRHYRGGRHYRHRHRGSNFVGPAMGFIAGAIAGQALSGPSYSAPRRVGNAHIEWCYNRYRSYRASDDTFQPYNGPRKRCNSPYN